MKDINGVLGLIVVWIGFVIIFYIRYKFPHFGMHFTNGISKFGLNDWDFDKNCKKHTNKDIDNFKRKQKKLLMGTVIIGIISNVVVIILSIK